MLPPRSILRPMLRWLCWLLPCLLSTPAAGQEPDPPRGDFRVVVISDLNSSYGSATYEPAVHETVRLIREVWHPDLVLAAGDLIAGQKPSLSDENVRAMWAAFDSVVARPLRQASIPFGFTVGNHDASAYPAHQRDRRLAVAHWRDPAHDPGVAFVDRTHYPLYYSFRQGPLFVLVWDASTAETARDTSMMAWVRDQLNGAEARAARHRWAIGHLPLYGIAEGRNRPGEALDAPDSLRAVLEHHRVDTYVSGHQHAYYPGRRGSLDLLHAGALGQGARKLLGSDLTPRQTVTIADFFGDAVVFTTYAFDDAQKHMQQVNPDVLPPAIHGFNGSVVRFDVRDAAVNPGR